MRPSGRAVLLAGGLVLAAACGGDDDLAADAGDDFAVVVGESPTFDGCGSSGDIVNYQWVIRGTPSDMSDDVDKPLREIDDQCSFTLDAAMLIDEVGVWTIELTVSDAEGNTSSDTVTVEVTG